MADQPQSEYRINPRNRRQVERRLDFGRWEVIATCANEQDAKALWFRLSREQHHVNKQYRR